MKTHWYDGKETQVMLLRSQAFFIKRTGVSRFINLLTHVLLSPCYLVNFFISIISFPMVLYNHYRLIKMHRVIKQGGVSDLTKEYYLKNFRNDYLESNIVIFFSRVFKYLPHNLAISLVNRMKSTDLGRAVYDNRQVILYLRPFRMDERKAMTVPFRNEILSLELIIKKFAQAIGPVVAFGGENISNTSITRIDANNENWKYKVNELLKRSRYVFIVPEDTGGTLWEIERILENKDYLNKAVFLNINSAGRYHPVWKESRNIYCEDDGETFKSTLKRIVGKLDYELPPLDQIVCAFVVNDELNLICSREILEPALWGASPKLAIYFKEMAEA